MPTVSTSSFKVTVRESTVKALRRRRGMLAHFKFDNPCTDPVEEIPLSPTASRDSTLLEQFGMRSFRAENHLDGLRGYSLEKLDSYDSAKRPYLFLG
eukprot:1919554-Pyramimonas_sp.AAC.2